MSFDNYSSGVSPIRTNTSLYKEPESDMCKRCSKYIYPLEMMGPVMGFRYHKLCFRCHVCERLLDFKNYRTNLIDLNDRELYCTAHTPRNGKYGDNYYSYNVAKGPGSYEVNEYASEYYKMHKSSDNLDQAGNKIPAAYAYIPADFSHDPSVNELNWKQQSLLEQASKIKISKSSEQLIEKSSTVSTSVSTSKVESRTLAVESHHHEIKSSSSSTGLATITSSSSSPKLYHNQESINSAAHNHASSSSSSHLTGTGGSTSIQVLPSSNINIDVNRSPNSNFYVNESEDRKSRENLRNIIVDVVEHNNKHDDIYNNSNKNNNQYETSSYYINQSNANKSTTNNNNNNSEFIVSSMGSGSHSNNQISNLKAIYTEAEQTNKLRKNSSSSSSSSHNNTNLYSTSNTINSTTNLYSDEQYRIDSNLKNIYAEASMSSGLRAASAADTKPAVYKDIPITRDSSNYARSYSTESNSNLKSIHSEAAQTDNLYNRQSSLDSASKDSNLKTIYSEATAAANRLSSQQNVNSTMNSHHSLYDTELPAHKSNSNIVYDDSENQNLKNIYAQAFISNSASQNLVQQQQQQQNVTQFSNVKEVYSEALIQHHHHYHSSSTVSTTGGRSGIGGSSTDLLNKPQPAVITYPTPITGNQITTTNIPVDVTSSDSSSNLKNILADVINTNNKAYPTNNNNYNYVYDPNKFNFTGPNAQLKKIIAEANDYNARINPNQYLNIKDARPVEQDLADMNQNNIIGENKGFGLCRLTVHYDQLRSRLSITVHEARYLKNLDKKSVSDPYARVYLAPDGKPSYKRKTKIVKSNLNPVWQETFDYPITLNEALNKTLTVNLKDERGFFEKQETQFLGEVVIPLKSVVNITSPFTKWYFLQPLNSNSNILLNSNISSF